MPTETLIPTAAGALNNWLVSAGTKQDAVLNEGGEYIYNLVATPNKTQGFIMTDLAAPASAVVQQVNLITRSKYVTAAGLKHYMSIAGPTLGTGIAIPVTTSYDYYSTVHPDYPGGSGWTVTQVNAVQGTVGHDPNVGDQYTDRLYMSVRWGADGWIAHFVMGLIGAASTLTQADWTGLFHHLALFHRLRYTLSEQVEAVREILNHRYPRYFDLGRMQWASVPTSLRF